MDARVFMVLASPVLGDWEIGDAINSSDDLDSSDEFKQENFAALCC